MSVVIVEQLAKSYGPQDLFWDVSCSVARGDRIALVGANGTGKTTLLRILAGLEEPTSGRVHRAKGLRIGYLPQGASLEGDGSLWQEIMAVFEPLRAMEARLHDLEVQMANPAAAQEALEAYAPLRERFEAQGGYTYQDRARHVLMGLGFPTEEHDLPVTHLSGGQKTRASLARLLLESPDLLLLDEPTNHLDLQAIEWLEGYLNTWEGTVILVAHDRYFMDRVVRKVWELAFGQIEVYGGNYSHYTLQRLERRERLAREYQAQQEMIARQEDFIQRNIAGQLHRQAKGRLKRLERFKEQELLERPREEQTISLRFQDPLRSGDKVLWTQDLVVGYEREDPLFHCPDLDLRRGKCVALLGPNGSGKTTLLKTLLGQVAPLAGYARLGASLKIGYFAQVHSDLDPDKTPLDAVLEVKNLPLAEARNFLARFLFRGDDVFKRIGSLSGGERSRVALARLVLERANFLLLDEPTNHLDIASQEILESVLDEYAGTILLVTHDRYLVDRLASQLWIINEEERALEVFEGTWAEYQEARTRQNPEPAPEESNEKRSVDERQARREQQRARREEEARRQQVAELEAEIQRLEHQVQALQDEIGEASARQEAMRVYELGTLYREIEGQLQERLELWSELAG
ncbi:MAG: ABC-F family ATP-binding cassette domain-containing protein [Anaerolineae bacterium]|jgi:ATP-binding cassette subfamily F protein 3|nr:ABC-F family ATP-binding cassette domain-containing protein [Anaerolineae bacterium]